MSCDVLNILLEHEEKAAQDINKSFSVSLNEKGMLLHSDDDEQPIVLELPQDLQHTLMVFFNESQSIPYHSENYNTLKSLLSTHACLSRMKNK